ncbi:MAG: ATP-binding protein [Aristaeellaceae bacterium]
MPRDLTPNEKIERSIIKRFRKELWKPFIVAVKRYELIQPGDKIAVCISGGKDSMLLAKLMQELHRHTFIPFEQEFIVMDPGYSPVNRARIEENARLMEIPIRIFDSDIFDVTSNLSSNPCYLCARMRRGFLYDRARELGCNKIALGHHFNDVIETTVMGMLYGAQLQGMMPKLHSRNFPGMELIRPLYCIHEDDILSWCRYNDLTFINCACRLTERAAQDAHVSKRQEVKELLRSLRQHNPDVEKSIFNSIHAVSLDTMPGCKWRGQEHTFLEWYDEAGEAEE